MEVRQIVNSLFRSCSYVIVHDGASWLVDCGDVDKILPAIVGPLKGVLLTHAHFDHIMGLEALKKRTGAPVYACIHEKRLCESHKLNQSGSIGRPCTVEVDHYLEDGEEVTLAGITMRTIFTPGHTEGSCAYYIEDGHILISGDTLFEGSIGRSDLPTGDQETLFESIRTKLYKLPDDTAVFSGHGNETTIGYEKKHNWFVRV